MNGLVFIYYFCSYYCIIKGKPGNLAKFKSAYLLPNNVEYTIIVSYCTIHQDVKVLIFSHPFPLKSTFSAGINFSHSYYIINQVESLLIF